MLRVEGGDAELAAALRNHQWEILETLPPRDQALCTVARKLSATPTKMVAGDWEPLKALGMTNETLLEVMHIVGLFNYLGRLADGAGLPLDPMFHGTDEVEVPKD